MRAMRSLSRTSRRSARTNCQREMADMDSLLVPRYLGIIGRYQRLKDIFAIQDRRQRDFRTFVSLSITTWQHDGMAFEENNHSSHFSQATFWRGNADSLSIGRYMFHCSLCASLSGMAIISSICRMQQPVPSSFLPVPPHLGRFFAPGICLRYSASHFDTRHLPP